MSTTPKTTNPAFVSFVGVILLIGLIASKHPVPVWAYNSDMVLARAKYPYIVGTRLDSCAICHQSIRVLNPYGTDYLIHSGDPDPFDSIELLDSDGDGYTNIQEIQAFTFPGDPNDPGPPEPPTLLSPANGTLTTTHALTFAWQAGAGDPADGYNLSVGGDVITTAVTTAPIVMDTGSYTWTARAYNENGYSDWVSPTWTVEITDTLAPGVPILLSPPDGTITTTRAITLTWQAGAGALPIGYNLQVDHTIITPTAGGTTLLPLLSAGPHTWTVRAYNEGGYSKWATPWAIEIRNHQIYLPVVLCDHQAQKRGG